MRISVFNTIYKPQTTSNINQTVHLKKLYDSIKGSSFPVVKQYYTLSSIEVCSSQAGCSIKRVNNNNNIKRTSKFVAYKDNFGEVRSKDAENSKKYVRMVISGKIKLNGVVQNMSIRCFKNGNMAVQLGLTNQPYDPIDENTDAKLFSQIIPKLKTMIEEISNIKTNVSISLINADGGNVFGQTGDKLPNAIKNFASVMKNIDRVVKTYEVDIDPGIGRRFVRVTFKSVDEGAGLPSLSLTNWGYCQIMGGKSCESIRHTFKLFKRSIANNLIKNSITYDMNKVQMKTIKTKNKEFGCPKSNPKPIEGKCPLGHHPRPKISKDRKKKTICCYKGELAKRHIKPFINAGMNIPSQLLPFMKKGKPIKNRINTKQMPVSLQGMNILFKGKLLKRNKLGPVPKGTMVNIAKSIGLMVPKAKKLDLFNEIVKTLKNNSKKSSIKSKSKTPNSSKKSSVKSKSNSKKSSSNSLANELENIMNKASNKKSSNSNSSRNSLANELEKNLLKKNNFPVYQAISPPINANGSPIPSNLYNKMHPKSPKSKSSKYKPMFPSYKAISPQIINKGSPVPKHLYNQMHPKSPNRRSY